MALVNKRIIDLPERTILRSDDYVALDSSDGGTAKYNITELETAVDDVAPIIVNTSPTATVLALTDGAEDKAVKKLTLNLLPHQAGSGVPSPSNVRAISGYDAVDVVRTGKNLLPVTVDGIKQSATSASWNGNVGTQNGVTFTLKVDENGNLESIVLNGTANANIQFFLNRGAIYKGNFLISGGISNSIRVAIYGKGNSIGTDTAFSDEGEQVLSAWVYVANGTVCNNVVIKPMVRVASISDPTYEPYQSDTYPITLPQTVYGGELDAVSGVLKVTKASYVMTEIAQVGWNGALVYIDLSKAPLNKSDANNVLCVCSHAQGVSNDYFFWHQSEDALASVGTARQLRYRNLSIEQSATAYNAYFAQQIANGTPVTFVYEIATPIEITLDPVTIKTLLGTNTVWMSADGTIQAEYPADTKLYIDALTAPDDDMIANTNIPSGKYFTVNNKLYISTSAIAQGEQIVVGTNCTQTDLATALNALNS